MARRLATSIAVTPLFGVQHEELDTWPHRLIATRCFGVVMKLKTVVETTYTLTRRLATFFFGTAYCDGPLGHEVS